MSDLVFSAAYTNAPVPNRERHASTIAAWQVAQTSHHTLAAYTRNLANYCTWLDAMGFDLLSVRRVHVDGYRHTLTGAPSTIARTLAALSSFYKYAIADGATVLNPVATVTRPAVDADHSSTQGLTRDQAKALLAVARVDDPRSHALVALLTFTGIRVGEALGARTTDYGHDSGHRTLTIRRKGGKSAKVAVPAPAAVARNEYLGTYGTDLVPAFGHGTSPHFRSAAVHHQHRETLAAQRSIPHPPAPRPRCRHRGPDQLPQSPAHLRDHRPGHRHLLARTPGQHGTRRPPHHPQIRPGTQQPHQISKLRLCPRPRLNPAHCTTKHDRTGRPSRHPKVDVGPQSDFITSPVTPQKSRSPQAVRQFTVRHLPATPTPARYRGKP
jgi:integrase/recombinase XerD